MHQTFGRRLRDVEGGCKGQATTAWGSHAKRKGQREGAVASKEWEVLWEPSLHVPVR